MSVGVISPAEPSGRAARLPKLLGTAADLWLAARMTAWALALLVLRRFVPLARLARAVSRSRSGRARQPERERRIVEFSRRLFGPLASRAGSCYPRSLLSFRFLAAANARPRLCVGMRRREGSIEGHAWVVVDGRPLGECVEELGGYTVVFELDPTES